MNKQVGCQGLWLRKFPGEKRPTLVYLYCLESLRASGLKPNGWLCSEELTCLTNPCGVNTRWKDV
jgi:hypothetical protein